MKYAIRWNDANGVYACGQCGGCIVHSAGPELCNPDPGVPICRECGRESAPELVALLDAHRSGTERSPGGPEDNAGTHRDQQTRRVRRFLVHRMEYPAQGLMVRIEDLEETSDGSLLSVAVPEATPPDRAIDGLKAVLFAVSGHGGQGLNRALSGPLGNEPSETS